MLTLYHAPTSACSHKARIALAELELDWTSHIIDIRSGEQFSPRYLALNPDAVVPTIDHDGFVLRESSAILAYLARIATRRKLVPDDDRKAGRIQFWLVRTLEIHTAINSLTFATSGRKADMARSAEEREARWAKLPDPLTRLKRRDLFEHGLYSPHVESAVRVIDQALQEMESDMRDGPWLLGSDYSLADTALIAYIDRVDRIGMPQFWQGRLPAVEAWLERSTARPSYQEGTVKWIPPGEVAPARTAGEGAWDIFAGYLA